MFDISEWAHSIPEAAELIAVDMWYSGELGMYFKISGPLSDEVDYEDGKGELDDRVISALQDPIKQIQGLLCDAIDRGELKPIRVIRDFLSNSIYPERTFLSHIALAEWLEQRLPLGEIFTEFEDDIVDILIYINEEIEILKKSRRDERQVFRGILRRSANDTNISESWKNAQAEIVKLREVVEYFQQRAGENDEPMNVQMTTRSRRTYQTIIAALCEKAGVDWTARGGAQKIIDALELMGIRGDGNTIRKILKEIPDALEARQK